MWPPECVDENVTYLGLASELPSGVGSGPNLEERRLT